MNLFERHLRPDLSTIPPVSSSNTEKYRDTDVITDKPIPAGKWLTNLAAGG